MPDSAELARFLLARVERAQRIAFRAEMEAKLSGDPVAVLEVQRAWQPWVELEQDLSKTPIDEPDSIVRNQDLNL